MWLHRHRSVARRPGLDSTHEPGGHLDRRHRRSQAHPAAALIDDRGGEIAAVTVANSPKGYRQLIDWLVEHHAANAVIGVESPGMWSAPIVKNTDVHGPNPIRVGSPCT
jgi:hypothetical protein